MIELFMRGVYRLGNGLIRLDLRDFHRRKDSMIFLLAYTHTHSYLIGCILWFRLAI